MWLNQRACLCFGYEYESWLILVFVAWVSRQMVMPFTERVENEGWGKIMKFCFSTVWDVSVVTKWRRLALQVCCAQERSGPQRYNAEGHQHKDDTQICKNGSYFLQRLWWMKRRRLWDESKKKRGSWGGTQKAGETVGRKFQGRRNCDHWCWPGQEMVSLDPEAQYLNDSSFTGTGGKRRRDGMPRRSNGDFSPVASNISPTENN